MNLVPDEDRADFAADIYDAASALDPLIRMADGTEMPGRLQLFCIALHGPDTAINSLLTSREAFQSSRSKSRHAVLPPELGCRARSLGR